MSGRICMRDYMRAKGLTKRPPCFYCGADSKTFDHSKPRYMCGTSHINNLKPTCRRCNIRKGPKTLRAFRAWLEEIELAAFADAAYGRIKFFGEGAAGAKLVRLRHILDCLTLREGKLVRKEPGQPLSPPKSPAQRAKDSAKKQDAPRWIGRLTFLGQRAVRALESRSKCGRAVIERFILGLQISPYNFKAIEAARVALNLNLDELRALKPNPKNKMP